MASGSYCGTARLIFLALCQVFHS